MNKLIKQLSCLAVAICLISSTAFAQDENTSPNQLYVADYDIEWGSIFEWIQIYQEHTVPLLQELQEEGVIEGWSAWVHNSGGEYNFRMVFEAQQWDDFDNFWDEFLSRASDDYEGNPEAMIKAHRDQIWNISKEKYGEDIDDAKYVYISLYQVKFSDMSEWNKTVKEKEYPLWDQAMEDNQISGYLVLGHNTGDRYNHKRVYLFDNWDHMDEFSNTVVGTLASDAELWKKYGGMIQAHTDVIWERVPDKPASESAE